MTPHFGLPEFGFLLRGLQWTVLLTLVAFVGGCTAGLIVALLRTCGRTTRGMDSPDLYRNLPGDTAAAATVRGVLRLGARSD